MFIVFVHLLLLADLLKGYLKFLIFSLGPDVYFVGEFRNKSGQTFLNEIVLLFLFNFSAALMCSNYSK